MQLENKDKEQLLHILIQTRRLTKIAFSTRSISPSEQNLIFHDIERATAILQSIQPNSEKV